MPSKYTNRLRRGTLTSKRGNKDYYKGYGARTEGVHTTKGAYVVLPERLMKIVAPDMSGFQVRSWKTSRSTLCAACSPLPAHTQAAMHVFAVFIALQLKPYVHTKSMAIPRGKRVPEFAADGSVAPEPEKQLR
jgi:hypothetical protein